MDPVVLVAGVAILALPAILLLAILTMFGSLVATLADGRFSIVRPTGR